MFWMAPASIFSLDVQHKHGNIHSKIHMHNTFLFVHPTWIEKKKSFFSFFIRWWCYIYAIFFIWRKTKINLSKIQRIENQKCKQVPTINIIWKFFFSDDESQKQQNLVSQKWEKFSDFSGFLGKLFHH